MLSILGAGDRGRELTRLRQQNDDLLQSFRQLKRQYEELVDANTQDQGERAALQEKTSLLEGELQACKDDLFRLQPVSQTSDSAIVQQYEFLNTSICEWVEDEVSRCMDNWQKLDDESSPLLFHHNRDSHAKKLLATYPDTAGEYIIRYRLQQMLHYLFYNEAVLLFGLHPADASLLQTIEEGMETLQPERDVKTIRAWRAETLAAMVGTNRFSAGLSRVQSSSAEAVFRDVVPFFPIIKRSRTSFSSLCEKIITPAADLAIKLQTSPVLYSFEPQFPWPKLGKGGTVIKDQIKEAKLIDIMSGKTLKETSVVVADERGRIGTKIGTLAPSLLRCEPHRQPIRLTQEVALVALDEPLGKRETGTVLPTLI